MAITGNCRALNRLRRLVLNPIPFALLNLSLVFLSLVHRNWKILLLDGHEPHIYKPFQLKAAEHNIKLFWFPSHLTHALQPLDVYPDLQLAVNQFTACLNNLAPSRLEAPNTFIDEDEDLLINTVERRRQREVVGEYLDSSPPPLNYKDSSDIESNGGSSDSIQANADFVEV